MNAADELEQARHEACRWHRIAAVLVHRLAGQSEVIITEEDAQAINKLFADDDSSLLVLEMPHGVCMQLVPLKSLANFRTRLDS